MLVASLAVYKKYHQKIGW